MVGKLRSMSFWVAISTRTNVKNIETTERVLLQLVDNERGNLDKSAATCSNTAESESNFAGYD